MLESPSLCLLDKQCCSAGHCPLPSSTHAGSWHHELASVAQHFVPPNLSDQNDVAALYVSSPMGNGIVSLISHPKLW